MIKYEHDPALSLKVQHIVSSLQLHHDLSRVACIRSRGSTSRRTLARCHALSRIMQKALGVKAHYVIEVISENFDRLNENEQMKTLIHELLHIPKGMKGGFRYHDYVCRRNVEELYRKYRRQN
ncbi:MAG: putative metallopeptidase [Candidatus Aenigmarchaeota archaeon]|nr:putative metallopeptidase [Candidatus Aenigmarchaeota archaeon]MDI6722173.1 putative metallopeptidase [Candidatus Aenigmarchaeota archaeon]